MSLQLAEQNLEMPAREISEDSPSNSISITNLTAARHPLQRIVTAQAQQREATMKLCQQCGNTSKSKGHYQSPPRSVDGRVAMRIRQLRACPGRIFGLIDPEQFESAF
jgi:hypothetical protein